MEVQLSDDSDVFGGSFEDTCDLPVPCVFVSLALLSIHTIQSDSIYRVTLIARLLLCARH